MGSLINVRRHSASFKQVEEMLLKGMSRLANRDIKVIWLSKHSNKSTKRWLDLCQQRKLGTSGSVSVKTISKRGLSKQWDYGWGSCWIVRQVFNYSERENAKAGDRDCGGNGSSSNEACKTYPLLHVGCTITERGPKSSRLTLCPFIHYLFLSGIKNFTGKVDKTP